MPGTTVEAKKRVVIELPPRGELGEAIHRHDPELEIFGSSVDLVHRRDVRGGLRGRRRDHRHLGHPVHPADNRTAAPLRDHRPRQRRG